MRSVFTQIDTVADSDSTVLLIGETGVGKELIAEYIHRISQRSERPFVKVGLAALPRDLLESELFGHEKGAFTSAMSEKDGLFELADTGTLFLDDIDDFPVTLQSKLLRVLESRELMRVGGTKSILIDVRVLCASKVDLKELVERGLFRADLYYRINVVPITIPPLRYRREDIPVLINHYLEKFAPEKHLSVSEEAQRAFIHYPWPGNIRELRNVVQRISLFAQRTIQLDDLPTEVLEKDPREVLLKACTRCFNEDEMSLEDVVACVEVNLIRQAMKEANGVKTHAAKQLKMNFSTFRDKLKKYNLDSGSNHE